MAGKHLGGTSVTASQNSMNPYFKQNRAFADGWEAKVTGASNPFTSGTSSATGAQFTAWQQGNAAANPPTIYPAGSLYETNP
jgi:hypothetical protein